MNKETIFASLLLTALDKVDSHMFFLLSNFVTFDSRVFFKCLFGGFMLNLNFQSVLME